MKTQTYIQVVDPCQENWDGMTPKDAGRHCDSCNKTVVDFSIMTDQQILGYLAKKDNNKLCGRFSQDQLQRALIDTQTAKTKVWQYAMAGFGALLLMLDKTNAQTRPTTGRLKGKPVITKSPILNPDSLSFNAALVKGELVTSYEEVTIKATVINESGEAICNAKVQLQNSDNTVLTNKQGKFVMQAKKMNTVGYLTVTADGYEANTVAANSDTIVLQKQAAIDNIPANVLNNNPIIMGALVAYKVEEKSVDTIPVLASRIFTKNTMFKITPNPVSKNGNLKITVNNAGTYSVQVFDANSRFIYVERLTVNSNGQQATIHIGNGLAAGVHFIKLVDEKTKKEYVEKIVVGGV